MTYMTPFDATVKMIYLAARAVVYSVIATGAWIVVLVDDLEPIWSTSVAFTYLVRVVCAVFVTATAVRQMRALRRIATARDEEVSAR